MNLQHIFGHALSSYRSTSSFIWNNVAGHLTNPIFTLLCFWSPPIPEGNIWLFCCQMPCIHLVNSFVCQLFGAGQVPYSGFLELNITSMRAVTMNQNSTFVGQKSFAQLRGTAELCDNSLWVCHYGQPLSSYR